MPAAPVEVQVKDLAASDEWFIHEERVRNSSDNER